MCTIILTYKYFLKSPLILGMNRDEKYLRKGNSPKLWKPVFCNEALISPTDISGGGTWFVIGNNTISALTNIETDEGSPTRIRSRGELPLIASQLESSIAVYDWVNNFSFKNFGYFNLLVGNESFCYCITYNEMKLTICDILPGIHVICNSPFDNKQDERLSFVENNLQLKTDFDIDEAKDVIINNLTKHATWGTCRHYQSFGTISSFVFVKSERNQLFWSEGAPCENEYKDLSHLFIKK